MDKKVTKILDKIAYFKGRDIVDFTLDFSEVLKKYNLEEYINLNETEFDDETEKFEKMLEENGIDKIRVTRKKKGDITFYELSTLNCPQLVVQIKVFPDGTHEISYEKLEDIFAKAARYDAKILYDNFLSKISDPATEDSALLNDAIREYIKAFLNKKSIIRCLILKETKGIYFYEDEKPEDFELIDVKRIINLYNNREEEGTKINSKRLENLHWRLDNFSDEEYIEALIEENGFLNFKAGSIKGESRYKSWLDKDELSELIKFIMHIFGGESQEIEILGKVFKQYHSIMVEEFCELMYNDNRLPKAILQTFEVLLRQQLNELQQNITKDMIPFDIGINEAYDALPNIVKDKISKDIVDGVYNSTLLIEIINTFKKICISKNKNEYSTENILHFLKEKSEEHQVQALLNSIFDKNNVEPTSSQRKH